MAEPMLLNSEITYRLVWVWDRALLLLLLLIEGYYGSQFGHGTQPDLGPASRKDTITLVLYTYKTT